MLTTLRKNRSLTFYHNPSISPPSIFSTDNPAGIVAVPVSNVAYRTAGEINGFNIQTNKYIEFNQNIQRDLFSRTQDYMKSVYESNHSPTASVLRDKNTWTNVKRYVTRQELMKLQIGDQTDLPLSNDQKVSLKGKLADKDLGARIDQDVESLIDGILRPDDRQYLAALKEFKETGKISDLLQSSKLDILKEKLESIDFDNITSEQYKQLKTNYVERNEYHHRESISSNPEKQSDFDNVEVLRTSKHNKRHTHVDEKGNTSVNYKKPVKEGPLDRNQDIRDGNTKRVLKREIKGLGLAVVIGLGVGFTIGFVTTLAQTGLNPDSLKNAAASGVKGGLESAVLSGVGFGMARSIGDVATQALGGTLTNLGITITENIAKMINMGVLGTLTIMAFSAYQFIQLKRKGASIKEALIQTGKQALFSLSILAVSIVAQGIWGGAAGIIVSVSMGIILISYSVALSVHERDLAESIRIYTINKCYPSFVA